MACLDAIFWSSRKASSLEILPRWPTSATPFAFAEEDFAAIRVRWRVSLAIADGRGPHGARTLVSRPASMLRD